MSDYLSHIVEQSMGIATSVQPLIAPIFAPPSFSAFISPEDMTQQPPDSAAEAAEPSITASPLPVPIDAPDAPESPSQPIAHHQSLQPAPKAERYSEQSTIQTSQREPAPAEEEFRMGKALTRSLPTPTEQGSMGKALPRPPRGNMGLPHPLLDSAITRAGQSLVPTEQTKDSSIMWAGQAHAPTGPAKDETRTQAQQAEKESRRGKALPRPLPAKDDAFMRVGQAERVGQANVLTEQAWQSFVPTEEEKDGARPLPTPTEQASRGKAQPRPLPIPTEQASRGKALPRPLPRRSVSIQEEQAERAWQSLAPTVSETAPAIPPMPPQPEIVARGDRGVQEAYATAKTDEVTAAAHVLSPRKQPLHASHPLDALVQQQSALYAASLLSGEISPSASQPDEENRRYTTEATGDERALFAVLDEKDELLSRHNPQRQLLAREYDGNPAPEPDAEQRPLTRSARRNEGANESAPLIRVSIGRVEVRAVTPPVLPPSKRAAPAAPALSLSDYLQRRKGEAG